MITDIDGNNLSLGTRVVTIDNLMGIKLKIGTVVGYTTQRVKIDFGNIKPSAKDPNTLIKVFKQE